MTEGQQKTLDELALSTAANIPWPPLTLKEEGKRIRMLIFVKKLLEKAPADSDEPYVSPAYINATIRQLEDCTNLADLIVAELRTTWSVEALKQKGLL